MAFTMRDEWKDEPASTTGAAYVEPSATDLIRPGQRVAHLFPRAVMGNVRLLAMSVQPSLTNR